MAAHARPTVHPTADHMIIAVQATLLPAKMANVTNPVLFAFPTVQTLTALKTYILNAVFLLNVFIIRRVLFLTDGFVNVQTRTRSCMQHRHAEEQSLPATVCVNSPFPLFMVCHYINIFSIKPFPLTFTV